MIEIFIIIAFLFFVVLLGTYNAYVIRWGNALDNNEKDLSRWYLGEMWHKIGAIIRIYLAFVTTVIITTVSGKTSIYSIIGMMIAILGVHWIIYDSIINIARNLNIFYKSFETHSSLERFFYRYYNTIKIISFAIGVLIIYKFVQ